MSNGHRFPGDWISELEADAGHGHAAGGVVHVLGAFEGGRAQRRGLRGAEPLVELNITLQVQINKIV